MNEEKNIKPKDDTTPQIPYETRDVHFRNLMIAGLGLVGLIVVMLVAAWLISSVFVGESANPGAPANTLASGPPNFPAPALQPNPVVDLQHMRQHEDSVLTTYAWSDRKEGLVRVPIDKAMALLLQQGLPVISDQRKAPERNRHGK